MADVQVKTLCHVVFQVYCLKFNVVVCTQL
jgi:hypothetical protein